MISSVLKYKSLYTFNICILLFSLKNENVREEKEEETSSKERPSTSTKNNVSLLLSAKYLLLSNQLIFE